MKGLILQDMLASKKMFKSYALIVIFYIILGVSQGKMGMFSSFLMIFAAIWSISTFGYREKCHWDLYVNIMPISRKKVVTGSYLYSGLYILAATILNTVLVIFDGYFNHLAKEQQKENMITIWVLLLVGIFYVALLLPIFYKFGSEKGKIYQIIVFGIPFIVALIISRSGAGYFLQVTEDMISKLIFGIIPIFLVVWVILSIVITTNIYEKKDLV